MYPGNMVCFRYIIVKTLHKSDNKDNINNICKLSSLFTEDKLHLRCKYLPVNVCGEIMFVNLKLIRNFVQAVEVKLH